LSEKIELKVSSLKRERWKGKTELLKTETKKVKGREKMLGIRERGGDVRRY